MKFMLSDVAGFGWDKGNTEKNWKMHEVSQSEIEEVFFFNPNFINEDIQHSQNENRWILFGKSISERLLFIVFTVRNLKIRVISARPMNQKEKNIYEEFKKNS